MKFIAGEKIDLCTPEDSDFPQWASWFNEPRINRYLEQGLYPNTADDQRQWYKKAKDEGRLVLLVKTKHGKLLGVTSISELNYKTQSCQISNVTPIKSKDAILAPLEARALMVTHVIENMGFEKIWASNCFPGLLDWALTYKTLGFRIEGFKYSGFVRGKKSSDSIRLSLVSNDYYNLKDQRCGNIWLGESEMRKLVKLSKARADSLIQLYENIRNF